MMKVFLIMYLMLTYSTSVVAQGFEVLEEKRAFKTNGGKIRKGDKLSKEEKVIIKENGFLTLDINYPRNLTMEAGQYQLDSLIENLKYRYSRHKKLYGILEDKELAECKFRYKAFVIPGSSSYYEADRITISDQNIESISEDTTLLNFSWKNPDKSYKGKYLIIVQEAYGQELLMEIIETMSTTTSINLTHHDEQFMQYSIKAEDCRSSLKRKIKSKF